MEIKVLGSGCPNCKRLLANVESAVKELAIKADIRYVTDFMDIVNAGIMHTPGLIVDDQIVSTGRVINVEDIKRLLK